MQPPRAFLLAAFLCSSCCDDAPPQPVPAGDLPPVVLKCGDWRIYACPGSRQSAVVAAPPIEHARSRVEDYTKGGRMIEDTLEGSGFVVTQEYDELGTVRQVLVEDPGAPLAVQIELDSNGTIRRIDTLRMARETTGGLLSVDLEPAGWRFDLDERGRIKRSESGVTVEGKVVRSIE